jgi:TetR/AcrR family transcriptional regulator
MDMTPPADDHPEPATAVAGATEGTDTKVRKRPKPGERRVQILQTLAGMLEQPDGEKITTAALAARLEVSEAALYRHFASKAQMFEGLIEFIEHSVFTLINQITDKEPNGIKQAHMIAAMLLKFAESNRGMTRVLTGDALVGENERLQQRMNQFFDKVEAAFRQCLRLAAEAGLYGEGFDGALRANVLLSFVLGRLQRFAKSGFKRLPTEHADAGLRVLLS